MDGLRTTLPPTNDSISTAVDYRTHLADYRDGSLCIDTCRPVLDYILAVPSDLSADHVRDSRCRSESPAMSRMRVLSSLLQYGLAMGFLTGCASHETLPSVRVEQNASSIKVTSVHRHGPTNLIENIGTSPDVPAGISLRLRRIESLHNTEPRYFIPAAGTLQIVSLDHPETFKHLEETISQWKQLLKARPPASDARKVLYQGQLSETPWTDGGRCFHAKLRYRDFPWGDAILFLTTYVQGKTGGPVNNDMLVLVVQGITRDGCYAVNGRFEIHHPQLPDSLWDSHPNGKAVFNLDEESDKAESWLDVQPDDSFSPTFAQYETFLRALKIR